MWKFFLVALLAAAQAPSINVYPAGGIAPLAVRVRTTIPKDASNRAACVFVVSDVGEESESCWSLDGDRAAVTTTRFYELSAGEYKFGLTVERAAQKVETVWVKITVIGN